MGLTLEENIERYGGKHGGLIHVRENMEGGMNVVPPFELLEPGQKYSWATRRAVLAACKDMGTDRVIVRTSEQADWDGMVDAMPTIVTGNWALSIMRAISKVRSRCENASVLKYAEREGGGYDPGRVTVSIAPHIQSSRESPRTLVTQHPTLEGAHLVDLSSPAPLPGSDDHFANQSFDYDGDDKLKWAYTIEDGEVYARQALQLAQIIGQSGILPLHEAFQFEGGMFEGKAKLFQIRKLADKRKAEFELTDRGRQIRHFGITPPDGVTLDVARIGSREGYAHFEADNPDKDYLLIVDRGTESLNISEQPSDRMKGYATKGTPALSHQSTRFVQMALRQEHGVSSLFNRRLPEGIRHGDSVRVICDGVQVKIEKLK